MATPATTVSGTNPLPDKQSPLPLGAHTGRPTCGRPVCATLAKFADYTLRLVSTCGYAAVNGHGDAGDPGSIIGCQEQHCVDNVGWLSVASEGCIAANPGSAASICS